MFSNQTVDVMTIVYQAKLVGHIQKYMYMQHTVSTKRWKSNYSTKTSSYADF